MMIPSVETVGRWLAELLAVFWGVSGEIAICRSITQITQCGRVQCIGEQDMVFLTKDQNLDAYLFADPVEMQIQKHPWPTLRMFVFVLAIGCSGYQSFSASASNLPTPRPPEEQHLLQGIEYMKLRLYDNAIVAFQQTLSYDATNVQTHFQLGHAYQFSQRLDDAIATYQEALTLPASRKMRGLMNLSLAEVYCKQSQFAAAETCAREAVQECPAMADAHYRLGYVYVHQGELEQAVEEFNAAVELRPDFAEVDQWLGQIALMQDLPEKAVIHYQKAIGKKPFDQSSYYNLAKAYRLLGDLEAAQEQLRKFEEIKHYQDAVYWAQKRVDEQPTNPELRMQLAKIHLDHGNIAVAIAEYQMLLALKPDVAIVYDRLGRIYMQTKQFQEAIPLFEKSLELDKKAVEPHLRLGWLYAKQEQFELAASHLQAAIRKSPKLALAYHGLAEIYRSRGEVEQALDTYQQIVLIDAKDMEAWIELGNLSVNAGRFDLAREYYSTALEIDVQNAIPYERLAWLYLNQGQYEAAQASMQQAIERAPKNKVYQHRLKQIQQAAQEQVK